MRQNAFAAPPRSARGAYSVPSDSQTLAGFGGRESPAKKGKSKG